MKQTAQKVVQRKRRHIRIRATVRGTPERPRLAFFRSNKNVYAQIIDDKAGKTILGISSLGEKKTGAVENAKKMGAELADRAKKKGITAVVFDRGGFVYTGSVEAFADAARAGGLKF